MKPLRVELGERSYPIHIGQGLLPRVGSLIADLPRPPRNLCIVTNTKVARLFGKACVSSLEKAGFNTFVITLPDGEKYKTLPYLQRIYDGLVKGGFDRSDAIVALGGGVVGDMAGFAAATYMRGISFVQVPTTLLAQVDSSVGGKTGVDHPGGKNLIGAFYQPKMVVCDLAALETLPRREYLCGLAEVIKYGVIRDASFFAYLEKARADILARKKETLEKIVRRSCAIKSEVVGKDERETGLRAILNFGHTFAHGIETALGFKKLKHGEAVAIGMVMAARLSARLGLADEKSAVRVERLMTSYGLPVRLPKGLAPETVVAGMEHDKKILSGKWRFVIFDRIGNAFVREVQSRKEISAVLV